MTICKDFNNYSNQAEIPDYDWLTALYIRIYHLSFKIIIYTQFRLVVLHSARVHISYSLKAVLTNIYLLQQVLASSKIILNDVELWRCSCAVRR